MSYQTYPLYFEGKLILLAAYDILQVPYLLLKTSRGFTWLYQSTRDHLIGKMNQFSASKRLLITGHNYGGALAGLDIAVNTKFTQLIVYTYSSPRIGDPHFSSHFNQVVANSLHCKCSRLFSCISRSKLSASFYEERIVLSACGSEVFVGFFQLNSLAVRNHEIVYYFKFLTQEEPGFT